MKNIKDTLLLITLYQHRYKSRQLLRKLDGEQLKDIGLTKEQALKEANRPFWVGDNLFLNKENSANDRVIHNVNSCAYSKRNPRHILAA